MLTVIPGQLTQQELWAVYDAAVEIRLDESCWADIQRSHEVVVALLASGKSFYGLNTGFGLLANKRIPASDLEQLQLNIVRSHCAGAGELFDDRIVRLTMLLKAASLARGFSGVRPIVVETLVSCLNAGILPCIPSQGSVGASGDLAPLAHMSLALIGEGEVRVARTDRVRVGRLEKKSDPAAQTRTQRRAGTVERDPDFDRSGIGRIVRGHSLLSSGRCCRGDVGRCGRGKRHSV